MGTTKIIKYAVSITCVLIVFGCATSQKMNNEDRAQLHSVRITESVKEGEVFLLHPGDAKNTLILGAIGGAIGGASITDAQHAFNNFTNKQSIFIGKIVREEIEQALRNSGKLTIADSGNASVPTINIIVPQYGFGVPHLFSSHVLPVLQIRCEMIDPSGKLIWRASDRLLPSIMSPMEPIAWDQLRDNPKEIGEQWHKASKYLAQKIIDKL